MLLDNEILSALMRRAASGDDAAFEAIVRHFEKIVYAFALQSLRRREDAEDATQEIFLKLWRGRQNWRGEAAVKTYIMRIARNTVIDIIRKRQARNTDSLTEDDDDSGGEHDIPDTSNDPAAEYALREQIAEVRRAIDALPPDHREIIILRDINRLSYSEIADTTGLEIGTVKSRLCRAREKLREILKTRNIFE
ncbi:MAG: sigma-70 family RNA polymerase sigma factor [Clostridia bacterium]|nr:sigma-70 family RNA polymerase sigma factor [Clostridia bacterium]